MVSVGVMFRIMVGVRVRVRVRVSGNFKINSIT